MSTRVTYCFAAFAVMLTHNMIFLVNGQCTVEGCENRDSAISIVEELKEQVQSIREILTKSFQQMNNRQDTVMTSLQAVDQRLQEQVLGMENLNASFQQMKDQQDTVMTSLRDVDRRSQEQDIYIKQVQSIHGLLNTSFLQMKNQQDTVMTRLQTVDRRSQEQDNYIKQVQSIHELLNASFWELKNQNNTVMTSLQAIDRRSQEQYIYIRQVQGYHERLNASFQQMKNQHDTVVRRLDVAIQLLLYHDASIKDPKENSWKTAIGVPLRPEIGIDLEDGLVLLPIANNWIILMHRFDGSLNFSRNWTEYRNGFGNIGRGEFWLGNEIVHRLTNRRGSAYTLRIEVQLNSSGRWFYAHYATFSLDSEDRKYTVRLSGYSGNAGDSLTNTSVWPYWLLGGMSFSTPDVDNDRWPGGHCARDNQAGWWFNWCSHSSLTCSKGGFMWAHSTSWETNGRLRAARMMIKSK